MSEADDYTPERIRYYLEHWAQLREQAEGGTGSLMGYGGGSHKRLSVVTLLADLEQAADQLPLQWSSTLLVFRAQGRARIWATRRLNLEERSLDSAIVRMARSLGWSE